MAAQTYVVDVPGGNTIRATGSRGSATSRAFAAMPVLRQFQWTTSPRYTTAPVTSSRVSYVEAANSFMVGIALAPNQRCERCRQGGTRFGECVVVFKPDGNPYMGGCCAHCRYGNHKEKCSHHVSEGQLANGVPPKLTFVANVGVVVAGPQANPPLPPGPVAPAAPAAGAQQQQQHQPAIGPQMQNPHATDMGPITTIEPPPEEFPGNSHPTYRRRRVPASELRARAEGSSSRSFGPDASSEDSDTSEDD